MRSGFSMGMLGRSLAITCLLVILSASQAGAVLLTDEELYFDPESADYDFYPRVLLPDLTIENTHTWEADGDPIVDANILPVLKSGTYPIGYAFSQDDYEQTPNVDYSADLTDGALTGTFGTSAQYMVRLHRESGASEIHTVFAETGMLEEPGNPDPTGPSRKISGPEGDLILVAWPGVDDPALDRAQENIANEGKTWGWATNVQGAINAIQLHSEIAGEKIHVELVGHGASGKICLNDQNWTDENVIGPDLEDIQEFASAIKDYCDDISLFGCQCASGVLGERLVQALADSLGHASGWKVPITVEVDYFNVEIRSESHSSTLAGLEEMPTEGSWGWIKRLFR